MWKLVKAELEYHKFSLGIIGVCLIGLHFTILGWNWQSLEHDGRGLLSLMTIATFLAWVVMFIRVQREKTHRFLILLPLRTVAVGSARFLPGMVVWLAFLGVYLVQLCLWRGDSLRPWFLGYLLSVAGIVFAVMALPYIHRDLMAIFAGKHQRLIVSSIYLVLVLMCAAALVAPYLVQRFAVTALRPALPLRRLYDAWSSTGAGALASLLAGLLLTRAGIFTFQLRRSYLE